MSVDMKRNLFKKATNVLLERGFRDGGLRCAAREQLCATYPAIKNCKSESWQAWHREQCDAEQEQVEDELKGIATSVDNRISYIKDNNDKFNKYYLQSKIGYLLTVVKTNRPKDLYERMANLVEDESVAFSIDVLVTEHETLLLYVLRAITSPDTNFFYEDLRRVAIAAIRRGANVHARDRHQNTPLHYCEAYTVARVIESLRDLRLQNYNTNNFRSEKFYDNIPDSKIADYEATMHDIREQLINKGAKIDAQNIAGDTPLHTAIFRRNALAAEQFVNTPGNNSLNLANKRGQTPLDLLEENESLDQFLDRER